MPMREIKQKYYLRLNHTPLCPYLNCWSSSRKPKGGDTAKMSKRTHKAKCSVCENHLKRSNTLWGCYFIFKYQRYLTRARKLRPYLWVCSLTRQWEWNSNTQCKPLAVILFVRILEKAVIQKAIEPKTNPKPYSLPHYHLRRIWDIWLFQTNPRAKPGQ